MPFERAFATVAERVEHLNETWKNHAAIPTLQWILQDPNVGRVAMVSSFGAESVVLLHMVSLINPDLPILFIDTEMLFEETLEYQREVAETLGLSDIRVIRADRAAVKKADPFGRLHLAQPDQCCRLRKTLPLQRALTDFDLWITGRKRFQGAARETLDLFENESYLRIKINPLAHWRRADLQDYIINNRLPQHPLVAQGYPSIGCAPTVCTRKVATGNDPRAGRWAGRNKTECGIHFGLDGQPQRSAS
ncbi:MAG: phosphoadenylyl-sulfate reductase [Pseudomonadota bacterium]